MSTSFPNIARVVLHGVGEPMMVPALPRMIRYLKDRGTYVLFNTNGTLLTERKGRALIDSGLDELRISLDAAEPKAFKAVRGRDMFARITRRVRDFRAMQRALGVEMPRVSLWLTGLKETVGQLSDFVRLAHDMDVPEVYLQRLVYFPEGQGMARPDQALFAGGDDAEGAMIREAEALAGESRDRVQRLRRDRPGGEPEAGRDGAALVAVPPALDADVHHRAWTGACRAASRRSRCGAMIPSPSATRQRRRCGKSGTASATANFARRC